MPPYRDLAAFDDRAGEYDRGWRGRLHHQISDRTAQLAALTTASPNRVVDVGCGTGYLLRALAHHYQDAEEFVGIDAAPRMIEVANDLANNDERLRFAIGVAERLPLRDDTVDLIVSTTSFDHWSDQLAGLVECARILRPGGHLLLVDQFSRWLTPTLVTSRRGKARTKPLVNRLLLHAGFVNLQWHKVHAVIIKAVTGTAPG
jgi:ubiquinone/menaquinone biosynthesis C-methylase UbiE